ncbi:MAG: excinuclease ABC subunit UvrA, partial [Muribaculaceae bacterium]|nr:excinuclease ABC subunit UvrA [Muribaculaceae bacterium]
KLIDSTPIGANVRSTVATYANVHDELRKIFARTADARALGYKAGDFSYNPGRLRCPVCDGTGTVSLDVQFLPDVDIPCPECRGSRYSRDAWSVHYTAGDGEPFSLPELMACDVDRAIAHCGTLRTVCSRLET